VALVVRETVAPAAVAVELEAELERGCVCADAIVAAHKIRARDSLFTSFSIWGSQN
jgi:hypothetical protein